jgi:hypothetical protein
MTPREKWEWFGNHGHFICGRWCRFHLATKVGKYFVSTVGEYWPERGSREIHAKIYDPAWLDENRHLKGDEFDYAYMQKFGYEEIGCDRKYETMVFKAGPPCEADGCKCGMPIPTDYCEIGFDGYNDASSATKGHMKMCLRFSRRKQ